LREVYCRKGPNLGTPDSAQKLKRTGREKSLASGKEFHERGFNFTYVS